MNQRLPTFLRSLQSLQKINTLSVAAALSAATSVTLGSMGDASTTLGLAYFVCGLSTFGACLVWMYLLRQRNTIGQSKIRLGWVLSIPIAAINAAMAAAVWLGASSSSGAAGFAAGLFYGATFGAIVWIPALMFTLLLFGLPIAWAQRQAAQGLAGEERGERLVGGSAFVIALVALVLSVVLHRVPEHASAGLDGEVFRHWYDPLNPVGYALLLLTGALGTLGGFSSVFLSTLRDARRKRFLREVEAGEIKGYRVDPTPEGKVLLRVPEGASDYRVGDLDEEELFALDEQGQARHAIEPSRS